MTVINELLAWSLSLGASWLRDALRRIATQPEISEADVEQLATLCKWPHGLTDVHVKAAPLAADHLPMGGSGGPVSLLSVTHVSDVNALAPNETIGFGKTGLTVVYGDNGAGKSGYARILKRACRARGSSEPILANALSDQPAGTPTAKLSVAVGAVEQTHFWKDGAPSPAEFGAVSVFDSSAAQVYVSDKTEVRFRPLGLDVLDKLASVCARVRTRLEGERTLLTSQPAAWPELPKDTEAARLLANLTALTSRDDVDRLTTLSDEEKRDLAVLTDVLAVARVEDPARKANDLRLKAARLRRLIDELNDLDRLLGKPSLDRIKRLHEEAASAATVAEQAAEQLAGQATLHGLGAREWREMWEHARSYSERRAYVSHPFPNVEQDAKCVLCQQALDQSARTRLARFEEFVKGEVQRAAAARRKEADDAIRSSLAIVPGERTKDALDDLALLDAGVFERVTSFLEEVRQVQMALRQSLDESAAPSISPPLDDLEKLAAGVEARAVETARAADPAKRKRATTRHAELQARSVLTELRPQILAEIDRKARINAYDACIRDTDTRALTKLGAELTRKYVTDALTAAFNEELKRLGFDTLELELRPVGAQRGVLYHQVFLQHATKAELPRVVSEGEGRCIALAAFLAEVRGAAHASAIVFDDPVSSLDHRWRTNVARRLVEEARTRQVIVFTHEMFFLATLLQEAEQQGVADVTQQIRRGTDSFAGHAEEGLPWAGLPTKRRITALKDRWQAADKTYRVQGEKAYEPVAVRMYADLRRTWERAIEEVLLNGVVVRFRPSIETQRLKEMGEITKDDLKTIEAGMTQCSKWEGGHDHAAATNQPLPPPGELQKDIEMLERWVAAVRKRRE